MQITAELNQVNISSRKVRLVADSIRKMTIDDALISLSFIQKRAARPLKKTLESAIANAVNNKQLAKENLSFFSIEVTDGPAYKRYRPSTRGRIHPYKKRTSHIRIILEDTKKEGEKSEDASITEGKETKKGGTK